MGYSKKRYGGGGRHGGRGRDRERHGGFHGGGRHFGGGGFRGGRSFHGGGGGFGGPREMHKAVCADCGQECEVPFVPTEGRPVYCRDCFQKHKRF